MAVKETIEQKAAAFGGLPAISLSPSGARIFRVDPPRGVHKVLTDDRENAQTSTRFGKSSAIRSRHLNGVPTPQKSRKDPLHEV